MPGDAAADDADGGVDDGVELGLGEVRRLAGAAERRDGVRAGADQVLDDGSQRGGIEDRKSVV